MLAGRGPGSRSRGSDGKRDIVDGEGRGALTDEPGLVVGTEGILGNVGICEDCV